MSLILDQRKFFLLQVFFVVREDDLCQNWEGYLKMILKYEEFFSYKLVVHGTEQLNNWFTRFCGRSIRCDKTHEELSFIENLCHDDWGNELQILDDAKNAYDSVDGAQEAAAAAEQGNKQLGVRFTAQQ